MYLWIRTHCFYQLLPPLPLLIFWLFFFFIVLILFFLLFLLLQCFFPISSSFLYMVGHNTNRNANNHSIKKAQGSPTQVFFHPTLSDNRSLHISIWKEIAKTLRKCKRTILVPISALPPFTFRDFWNVLTPLYNCIELIAIWWLILCQRLHRQKDRRHSWNSSHCDLIKTIRENRSQ